MNAYVFLYRKIPKMSTSLHAAANRGTVTLAGPMPVRTKAPPGLVA